MSSTRVSRSFYLNFFFNKQLFVIIKDVFFFWFFFEGDSGGLRWGIDWVTCRDLETFWEFRGWGLEIMKKSFTKKKNSQFFVTIMMWQNVIGGNV